MLFLRGRLDPLKFFRGIYSFMKGTRYDEEKIRFQNLFDMHIQKRIYKEALDKIEWHRKQGHIIAIVTNSLELMIGRIKETTKIKHLIASELEVKNGKITGTANRVSYGINKAKFIKKFAQRFNIDLQKSYAYSDNSSDVSMLETVGNPVAVNPQWGMLRTARQRNWKIINFTETGG